MAKVLLGSLGLVVLVAVGCGDDASGSGGGSSTTASTTTTGQGVGGTGGEAAQGGQGGGAIDPLEQAIRATNWAVIDGAPTAPGGAKQDDIFFVDPMLGFIADGPGQAIHKTTDGGATWEEVFNSPGTYFRTLIFTSPTRGFAGNFGAGISPSISDATVIYETSDGGTTWSAVSTIAGAEAKGLCGFNEVGGTIYGVGRANGPSHLVESTDDGATWTAKDLSSFFSMAVDARFTAPGEGLVAGMTGYKCTIGRTTDGGDTFTQVFQAAATGSLCWKLDFPSDTVGYVAILQTSGGPPSFAKTTDGGLTWTEMPLPDPTGEGEGYPALAVGFINEKIGWVTPESSSAPVYRTFDGGVTWEEDPALKGPINRFRFLDDETGFAVGGKVWKLDLSTP
ncbi:MAG: hypothetical protein HOV80_38715 [Polyangiaceae bacterium]|nr:hypothetical protein [Polyangiaceae bacterium]